MKPIRSKKLDQAAPRGRTLKDGPDKDAADTAEETAADRVKRDFKRAYDYKKKWLNSARQDFEFGLGKQWNDQDLQDLKASGRPALTRNKIRPMINLLVGMESQNRTDWTAFPEGEETCLEAEIATLLLKNIAKNSGAGYHVSQLYENNLFCGEGFIEAFPDYTNDLLNADLKLKNLDYNQVFPEPGFKEYDMSDAGFICKVTYGLTKEQLVNLFPDKEDEINAIESGHLDLGITGIDQIGGAEVQRVGYPVDEKGGNDEEHLAEKTYDLLERYYKKYVPVYWVLDPRRGTANKTSDKTEADNYAKAANAQDLKDAAAAHLASQKPPAQPAAPEVDPQTGEAIPAAPWQPEPFDESTFKKAVTVLKRFVPEVWVTAVVGQATDVLDDRKAWSFPNWKGWPIVPAFCYWVTTPIKNADRDLTVQGIVRPLKDPQFEHNKRRSQMLHHLNTSVNSGLTYEEETLVNEAEVKKYGSTPGVHLVVKTGKKWPEKNIPTPLSQGHAELASLDGEDMKAISGLNTDLLAMAEGGTSSGRAIAIRQRQGLVMVQKIFDNLSQTKWILGKLLLSQLSVVFDLKKAMRVLGNAFLLENFGKPKMAPAMNPQTRQPMVGPDGKPAMQPVAGPDGQPVMEIDQQAAAMAINKVLNAVGVGEYDVAIGESAANDTVRYSNYLTLLDVASKAATMPPPFLNALIDESMLPEATKAKLKRELEAMQQAAAAQAAAAARIPAGQGAAVQA